MLESVPPRRMGRGTWRMARRRRTRRPRDRCAAQAPGAGDRHVGLSRGTRLPRPRALQGHAAPFEPPCRRRGLGRQALRRRRFQQLRARHRRRSVGARRCGHHDPAFADAGHALRDIGALPSALFRGRARQRHHDGQGRSHGGVQSLRAAARGDAADGARRSGARIRPSTTDWKRRASASPSARTRPASGRCISGAARATTSMSAPPN